MNSYFLCILILLVYLEQLKGFSEEYYDCLDSDNIVNSHSDCTSINIPESEGYKCCSIKVSYESTSSYNCFPIENKYTTSQELLNEYITKKNLAFLFGDTGGKIEIECPNQMKTTENYEKFSDEYLNCYESHKKGVNNENDCTKYEIPTKEGNKCCFLESSQINNDGTIVDDKRCYIIQNEYFKEKKNFSDYLLDESNIKSLDQIINTNITIKCKNYDKFFFQGIYKPFSNNKNKTEPDPTESEKEKSKSKLEAWIIVLIIIGGLIFLIGIGIIFFLAYRKKKIIVPNDEIKSTEKKLTSEIHPLDIQTSSEKQTSSDNQPPSVEKKAKQISNVNRISSVNEKEKQPSSGNRISSVNEKEKQPSSGNRMSSVEKKEKQPSSGNRIS